MEPKDESYKFYGFYEFTGSMSANSLKSGLRGPNNIIFTSDNQHIRFRTPDFKLGGTVMGERTIEADGSVIFEDLKNNWKAVVLFSTYKKSGFWTVVETGQKDEYVGTIYECKPIDLADSTKKYYSKHTTDIHDLSTLDDVVRPLGSLRGSFLKELVIDEKQYWNIDENIPARQIPLLNNVCPSDWRYREDLLWLKLKYMKIA